MRIEKIMLDYLGDYLGFPGGASGKEPTSQCRRHKRCRFDPWVRKVPLEESVATTPVFLPGEDPLDRGAWQATGHKESDTTEAT